MPEVSAIIQTDLLDAHGHVQGSESIHVLQNGDLEGDTFTLSDPDDFDIRVRLTGHVEEVDCCEEGTDLITTTFYTFHIVILSEIATGEQVQDASSLWHDVEAELELLLFIDSLQLEKVISDHFLSDEPIEPRVRQLNVEARMYSIPILQVVDTVDGGEQIVVVFEIERVLQFDFVALVEADEALKDVSRLQGGRVQDDVRRVTLVHIDEQVVHFGATDQLHDGLSIISFFVFTQILKFEDAVKVALHDDPE